MFRENVLSKISLLLKQKLIDERKKDIYSIFQLEACNRNDKIQSRKNTTTITAFSMFVGSKMVRGLSVGEFCCCCTVGV